MDTPIIVAMISLFGSIALAMLNFFLQQRMRKQEEQGRQTAQQLNQQGERIAEQQNLINTLVAYTMSSSVFRHLAGIALLKTYNLRFGEANRREMYFLRDHGFIQPRDGSFVDFVDDGREYNVAGMAATTPVGELYVKLRKNEIPPEMRNDIQNLRVDLSTL